MNAYEVGVIIRADLDSDGFKAMLETLHGWIEDNDGIVNHISNWGRRRLAYPIRKQRDGYYIFYRVDMPPASTASIERNLKLNENVLRFLVTKDEE